MKQLQYVLQEDRFKAATPSCRVSAVLFKACLCIYLTGLSAVKRESCQFYHRTFGFDGREKDYLPDLPVAGLGGGEFRCFLIILFIFIYVWLGCCLVFLLLLFVCLFVFGEGEQI